MSNRNKKRKNAHPSSNNKKSNKKINNTSINKGKKKNNKNNYEDKFPYIFGGFLLVLIVVVVTVCLIINNNTTNNVNNVNNDNNTNTTTTQPNFTKEDINEVVNYDEYVNTSYLTDKSFFVNTDDTTFKGGNYFVINGLEGFDGLFKALGKSQYSDEFYFLNKMTKYELDNTTFIAYVDEYEEDCERRYPFSLVVNEGKLSLKFFRDEETKVGNGYWVYLVAVKNETLDGVNLSTKSFELNIE